jgi:hypothetical protein
MFAHARRHQVERLTIGKEWLFLPHAGQFYRTRDSLISGTVLLRR